MHEALFDDGFLKDTGVSTLDFAKAMIDEGYHPMTMYFPLVVHGAMLIEPTESQAKEDLDQFIGALRSLAERAKSGSAAEDFKAAPRFAPRRRLDETLGRPQAGAALAAEQRVQAGGGIESGAHVRSPIPGIQIKTAAGRTQAGRPCWAAACWHCSMVWYCTCCACTAWSRRVRCHVTGDVDGRSTQRTMRRRRSR